MRLVRYASSAALLSACSLTAFAQGQFLRSVHDLADPRGYCLDIPGFGPRMQLDGPIGTHSCKYSLPGFDVDELFAHADQKLRLVNYDRCLAADALQPGSDVTPIDCDDAHGWELHADGRVTPTSDNQLCLTLAAERVFVNSSVGLVTPYSSRAITLEPCAIEAEYLQQWRWSAPDEQVTYTENSLRGRIPRNVQARNAAIGAVIDPRATAELYRHARRIFGPADVKVSGEISYGPNARHLLKVYEGVNRNAAGGAGAPVIALVHGGGYAGGNLDNLDHAATHFAGLGFVAVNITYPLAPEHKWPSGAESVAAAMEWVNENIAEYRGDAQRVYLMGHSAGGNHVANYVLRPGLTSGPSVAGAILVSPSLPLDPDGPPDPYAPYFEGAPGDWADIRLLANIEDASTPVLITVAQYDPEDFHHSTARLYSELVALGARPRLRQIPSHGHISYVTAIGTGDRTLVEEMLDFMLADW